MVGISIYNHDVACSTHSLYTINFHEHSILTTVTHTPSVVTKWIKDIQFTFPKRKLIVGIDIEWRPMHTSEEYYPAATLQICVGHRCLIYQLIYTQSQIPQLLLNFLANPCSTFVGVGIDQDIERLETDYAFGIGGRVVDLAKLAAEHFGEFKLRYVGLKAIAKKVLGVELEKRREITLSRWDSLILSPEQVQYACIDAFVSFEIGRVLNAQANPDVQNGPPNEPQNGTEHETQNESENETQNDDAS